MDLYRWVVNVNRYAKINIRIVPPDNVGSMQITTDYFNTQIWLNCRIEVCNESVKYIIQFLNDDCWNYISVLKNTYWCLSNPLPWSVEDQRRGLNVELAFSLVSVICCWPCWEKWLELSESLSKSLSCALTKLTVTCRTGMLWTWGRGWILPRPKSSGSVNSFVANWFPSSIQLLQATLDVIKYHHRRRNCMKFLEFILLELALSWSDALQI